MVNIKIKCGCNATKKYKGYTVNWGGFNLFVKTPFINYEMLSYWFCLLESMIHIWHQLLSQVLTRFNLIYFILVLCIHICSIISRSYHSFWLWHVRYKNSGFLVGNELNIEKFSMIWNVKGNNSTQILAKDLQKVSKLLPVSLSQRIR